MDIKDIPETDEILNLSEITDDEVVNIPDAVDKDAALGKRYSCGFPLFDEAMLGGFKHGDLVIISGKSGQGKTTLAQTITYNLCKSKQPCLWFSYEVSVEHLDRKFRSMEIDDFYHAYIPKKQTTGRLSWIKHKIKESKIKFDTRIVFIDHIDFLVPSKNIKSDSREIMLKNVAMELKTLAIEENVVIVLLAHLKKLQADKEPDMEDIGYSAGIFQNADYVIFVMREKLGNSFGMAKKNIEGEVYSNNSIIKYVKNRETGQLKFIKCNLVKEKLVQLINIPEEPDVFSQSDQERGQAFWYRNR